MIRFAALLLVIAAVFILFALAACGGLKIEGQCQYVREVKTTYVCLTPDAKVDHIKVLPLNELQ